MPPLQRFIATRSRVARDSKALRTPEPFEELLAQDQQQQQQDQLSPPRQRLRLRKRAPSNLRTPSQQFLASVAAADVPIPSIEEPQVLDEDMLDADHPALSSFFPIDLLPTAIQQHHRGRNYSPPKTPAPGTAPALLPHQFPDWAIDSPLSSSRDSSPESSRPSTARSTQTSASLFSQYSVTSAELSQCVSPELSHPDRFGSFLSVDDACRPAPPGPASKKSRRAPWTRQMSSHVWATYVTYLQDPKVTPFRIGKSGIPPHGVCMRVAREAKRSWRRRPQHNTHELRRSATPTLQTAPAASSWPHTCAATRAHLRDLCKANASSSARDNRYLTRSPTPFGRTAGRFWNRRSVPAPSKSSVFSSSEMAMSLAVSTADSMQPDGPLAQITSSQHEHTEDQVTPIPEQAQLNLPPLLGSILLSEPDRSALGSPFTAKSYGPSSSNNLAGIFDVSGDAQRQNQTADRRRLASPARLTQSKPASQKRRPAFLEARNRKRPSLGTDFWTNPTERENGDAAKLMAEFSSTASNQRDSLFVPRTNIQQLFEASHPVATAAPLSLVQEAPARLGSPFTAASTSLSVPNRFSSPARLGFESALRKPFATVQQASNASSAKTALQTRLAYIDQRLKDFRRRGSRERRSESPK